MIWITIPPRLPLVSNMTWMTCSNAASALKQSIRTPQSIQSYATLATIIFQTNQNEQHGGQAIPAFDFFMAEGFGRHFANI